jgi:hypothetical protein
MANIIIDVAAEFTGQRAFDQAGKSTLSLERSVKKLAKTFGITFAASTIINYSKESIKAFAADEAAALRLTRAVDNLGIGFANPAISKYISDLERSASIADDILRPAFQALLTTTGSLTKSQELLNNAITISRASGIDLATVSQDLANGYVGITKGLRKYNSGLTTAELNSKSFAEVLGVILSKSAGAAQDYLSSTQYKMDALGVATNNASEIIGGGLVNAFARIAGGTEVSDAQKAIEGVATGIAHITEATGAAIGAIPNLLKMLGNLPKNIFQGFAGKAAGVNLTPIPTTPNKTELTKLQQQKALAKLESDAAKRAKELLALQKKQSAAAAKAAADKAKLDKAASIFDLQKIEIAAALKGKISDEERTRLLLMQAIQDEDAKKAEELQKTLEDIQKKNKEIIDQLTTISTTDNPFTDWATSLGAAAAVLGSMPALISATGALTARGLHNIPQEPTSNDPLPVEIIADPATSAQNDFGFSLPSYLADQIQNLPWVSSNSPATNFQPSPTASDMWGAGTFGYSLPSFAQPPVTVNVTTQGSVILQDELVKVVNDAVVTANTNGYNNYRPGAVL